MNKEQDRVIIAMSGGVDSAVAALLLKERGYEVRGAIMKLWREEGMVDTSIAAAQVVAEKIDIPLDVVDCVAEFRQQIVDYFITAYARGLTPNPCVVCNRALKFGLLLKYALENGAHYLATGHYVRVYRAANGEYQLRRGSSDKDQSYFLYTLRQDQLARVLFPLGEYDKEQVREIAAARDLSVANRNDSQDLCFVRDNNYRRFLQDHAPQSLIPGPIYNRAGERLGEHRGLPFYTIGQRRGLGLDLNMALFVLEQDGENNTLIVGTENELGQARLRAVEVNWVSGAPPAFPCDVTAKIRYRSDEVAATITAGSAHTASVTFAEPLRDITPGQSVVFYQEEIVLGGGVIAAAE